MVGRQRVHQKSTEQPAVLGYVALATDIYGKGIRAKSREEAMALAGKFRNGNDRSILRARANAGLDVLRKNPLVDLKTHGGHRILFRRNSRARACQKRRRSCGCSELSWRPRYTPDDAKNIKGKARVLTGADDSAVKPEQVIAFEDKMRRADVDWHLMSYGNAVHAFCESCEWH